MNLASQKLPHHLGLLREHRFYHGIAAVEGRVVLFFYFQEADTGIAALIP